MLSGFKSEGSLLIRLLGLDNDLRKKECKAYISRNASQVGLGYLGEEVRKHCSANDQKSLILCLQVAKVIKGKTYPLPPRYMLIALYGLKNICMYPPKTDGSYYSVGYTSNIHVSWHQECYQIFCKHLCLDDIYCSREDAERKESAKAEIHDVY